jgi:hypothetical protein
VKHLLYLVFLLVFHPPTIGQTYEVVPPKNIKTIIFKSAAGEFSGTPIIKLGQRLQLEFDDLNASETDYYYEIKHYNYDWTPSTLAQNEYLTGFDDVRIFNFQNSLSTFQPYTNYKLDIPNQNTRAITKTGNYMLIIKNVNDNIIFSRKFIVYSSDVDIQTTIREDRRLDKTDSHQVVNFEIGRKGYIFRNPNETVNVAVIQNNDFSTGIFNLKPQYTTGNTLIYRYNEKSSFKGGNEFLNFDSKDVRAGTSQIRSIELSDIYESFLFTDFDRSNSVYTFNPDINGNFKINTIQGNDISREADYTRVHFKLQTPQNLKDGEVHIYGQFNNYMLTDDTMMTYNSRTNLYEGSFELKQGFYNYKYVYFTNEGEFINNIASGNFAQTENLYTVIVYYRPIGGRFDEVIGMSNIISRNIKN